MKAGKTEAARGRGVITDPVIHARVLRELEDFVTELRTLAAGAGATEISPLLGPAGNREFLVLLEKTGPRTS